MSVSPTALWWYASLPYRTVEALLHPSPSLRRWDTLRSKTVSVRTGVSAIISERYRFYYCYLDNDTSAKVVPGTLYFCSKALGRIFSRKKHLARYFCLFRYNSGEPLPIWQTKKKSAEKLSSLRCLGRIDPAT